MSRFVHLALAAVVLVLSATAASSQIYPLNNGPNGTGSNTVDSAKGFDGINAVAPERELLYHPERGGNAAAQLGIAAVPGGGISSDDAAPDRRHAQPRRRRAPLR